MAGAREPLHRKVTKSLLRSTCFVCQFANSPEFERILAGPAGGPSGSERKASARWPRRLFCVYLCVHFKWCLTLNWTFWYTLASLNVGLISTKMAGLELAARAAAAGRGAGAAATNASQASGRAPGELAKLADLRDWHLGLRAVSRVWLRWLGQPLRELHWILLYPMATIMVATFSLYIIYVLLSWRQARGWARARALDRGKHARAPLMWVPDLRLARAMLNPRYDALQSRRLVLACARDFKRSSAHFLLDWAARAAQGAGEGEPEQLRSVRAAARSLGELARDPSSRLGGQFAAHLLACAHIDGWLAGGGGGGGVGGGENDHHGDCFHGHLDGHHDEGPARGSLEPVNRSAGWLNDCSRQYALEVAAVLVYACTFVTLTYFVYPAHLGKFLIETPADLLASCEIWLINGVATLAFAEHVIGAHVNTSDQGRYMVWLVGRVARCVKLNDELFSEATRTERNPWPRVNANTLRALLEYEIFLAQFRPVRRSFTFASFALIGLTLSSLVLLRLQMPYCNNQLVPLFLWCSGTILFSTNPFQVPICRLNSNSERLYARLASLLSQAIEFEHCHRWHWRWPHPSLLAPRGPHNPWQRHWALQTRPARPDEHLMWRLRALLADGNAFTRQFGAHLLPGVPLTWPNFIRLRYWSVLIILSQFFWTNSWQRIFGGRLNDPLGLLHGPSVA